MVEHTSGMLIEDESKPEPELKDELKQDSNVTYEVDSEDWMEKLSEDEVFNGKDGPGPRLKGLRRLAKPFIQAEDSRVNALIVVPKENIRTLQTYNSQGDLMSTTEEVGRQHFPMASVTFSVTDVYGRTFSDSADAYYSNCNELGLYPTAVASARAEARVLRKLLGISAHSAEEMSDKQADEELAPDDDAPAKAEQVKLIEKMLANLEEYSMKDLFEEITIREIYSVSELTTGEARKSIRILNDRKKKKKRGSKK